MKYNDILDDDALSGVLRSLDDSVTVPSNAAAGWRTGVQKKMRFDKKLNNIRWIGEIAAVFIVVLCLFVTPASSIFSGNKAAEPEINRNVKYAYSEIKLMASGLSFIESDGSDLGAAKEAQTEEFTNVTNEEEIDAVYALDDTSDTSVFMVDGDNLVVTTRISCYTKSVENSVSTFKQIASSYDTIAEDEISQKKGRDTTVFGKLRVRKDEAEEFIDAVKKEFPKADISIESHDFESSYVDASSRIYDLEDVISSLKTRVDMAEQDEIEGLRDQLSKARNELDSIRAEADEYLLDKEYVTVDYTFTNARSWTLLGSTGSSVIYFFGLMVITIALTVLITLHISSARRKRRLFA